MCSSDLIEYSTPLINDLEIKFFKDKEMEEEVGITDFINRIVQVLKGDLYWFKISVQDVELIKPVEL